MSTEHQDMNSLRDNVQKSLTDQVKYLQLIPTAALKLLQLTNDENSDIRDLSRVINTEPALNVQVLKTVNSALFNFPQPIDSIQRAITVLGFSRIRMTAVKLLFYNKLIAKQSGQSFDLLFFWQHCLFVATLSRDIAIKLNYPDPDLLYTAGLLHDIGKLVLENYGKVSYSDFISSYANSTPSSLQSELNFFGVSHEQVGQVFCLKSQLPKIITAVVAHHHSDQVSDSNYVEFKKEIAIVSFADYLAWAQGIGSFSTEPRPSMPQAAIEIIDIANLDIESLFDHVDQEMQATSQFYGIQFPTLNQLRAKLVQTSIQFSKPNFQQTQSIFQPETNFLSTLTIPHQSLEPEIFIPQTLLAIHETFKFDRVFMLNMTSRHRSLVSKYFWPNSLTDNGDQTLEIKIDALTDDFLTCLRTQQAAIISDQHNCNHRLLKQIGVAEFIAVPILRNNRISAVLYADNKLSKIPIQAQILAKVTPIANELGSALQNAKRFELERTKAEMDPLTGLSNKRMITGFLDKLYSDKRKELEKIAVGFLDIDHFKKLNDDCGHQTGDAALKIVANILHSLTRNGDFIGRYGGEEFVFVLPDSSPSGAYLYAERIRAEIETKGIILRHRFNNNELTVSVGFAMYQPQYKTYQDLIAAADKAMYQAKNSGRNKVVAIHRA
jgi:diguanylate cyclase (GGDEF)-like protein/putative nucleotidyltransferase with HDIG domain